jgi:hypothetical protein
LATDFSIGFYGTIAIFLEENDTDIGYDRLILAFILNY